MKIDPKVQRLLDLSGAKVIPFYDAVYVYESIPVIVATQTGGLYLPTFDCMSFNSQAPDLNDVILHELTHWTGHSSRLSRPRIRWGESNKTSQLITVSHSHTEEFVAEITSNRILKKLGVDHTHSDQLLHKMIGWYAKGDLAQAMEWSYAASDYLMDIYNQVERKVA